MSQRRSHGGARHEASERVVLRDDGVEIEGWTLNLSRGGLRIVVDGQLAVGSSYEVHIGTSLVRRMRVVWIREEADGQIAGLQFLEGEGGPSSVRPPESSGA